MTSMVDYRIRDAQERAYTRQEVVEAYGGQCECCSENQEALLLLAYHNIDEVLKVENRLPLNQAPAEFRYLKVHEFPQNGRTLICRRCNRYTNKFHFTGKCELNHSVQSPGIHDEINQEALKHALHYMKQVVENGSGNGYMMPTTPLEVLLHYRRPDLTHIERQFVDIYKYNFYRLQRGRKATENRRMRVEEFQYKQSQQTTVETTNADDPFAPVTIVGELEMSEE